MQHFLLINTNILSFRDYLAQVYSRYNKTALGTSQRNLVRYNGNQLRSIMSNLAKNVAALYRRLKENAIRSSALLGHIINNISIFLISDIIMKTVTSLYAIQNIVVYNAADDITSALVIFINQALLCNLYLQRTFAFFVHSFLCHAFCYFILMMRQGFLIKVCFLQIIDSQILFTLRIIMK